MMKASDTIETATLESFYSALVDFLTLSKHQMLHIAHSLNLTTVQALAIMSLHPDEPRAMSEFSSIFGCDASNVTGIMDGLERKKFVSRQASATDRRVKLVMLEPEGEAIRSQIIKTMSGENSYILSRLNDTELKQFIKVLKKITAPAKK